MVFLRESDLLLNGKQTFSRANFALTAKFNDYFECRLKATERRKKWMTAIVRTLLVCVM